MAIAKIFFGDGTESKAATLFQIHMTSYKDADEQPGQVNASVDTSPMEESKKKRRNKRKEAT